MARTAVVAGTAAHVASGRQASRDAAAVEAEQQAAPAPVAPAPVAPAPAAPVAQVGMTDEKMSQLERLADMRDQGILTDEEFAEEKAKILAG